MLKLRKIHFLIVVIIIVILITGNLIFFLKYQKAKNLELSQTKENLASELTSPEKLQAGKIGESEETFKGEKIVILPAEPGGPPRVLPPAIFNASGAIKEINKDSLVVSGTGYNFADQKPRDLTLKFADNTITNAGGKTKQIGLEGLTGLKVGDSITFESPENIRGKTEFEVSYVNKF